MRPNRPPRRRRLLPGVGMLLAILALPVASQPKPLPPEQAFRFSARAVDPQTVEARFTIADGYYLYRDKIHFAVEPGNGALVMPALPTGRIKHDEFFGNVETYRGSMTVNLAIRNYSPGRPLVIRAESQGCADIGLCYPPTVQTASVALPQGTLVPGNPNVGPKKPWFN